MVFFNNLYKYIKDNKNKFQIMIFGVIIIIIYCFKLFNNLFYFLY